MMSNGLTEPAARRRAISVVGMRETDDVFSTANVTMSSLASSEQPFGSDSFSIAFMPRGVAALPRPRRFALMFAAISSVPMLLLQASGKSSFMSGDMSFASSRHAPHFEYTSIIPHQSAVSPRSDIERETAFEAPSIIAEARASIFPMASAKANEIALIAQKIFLSMESLLWMGNKNTAYIGVLLQNNTSKTHFWTINI